MKKILLIIFLTSQIFATDWYVNKNVSSSGNGQSWATAWKNFSNIVWSSLQPGDRLFISGGTDSTIYYETLTPQCRGTYSQRITIIAGKYSPSPSGHSGRVIIDGGNNTRAQSIYFDDYSGTAPRYVTIKGFECRRATAGIEANIDAARGTSYGCVIDSCYIYDFYDLAGVFVRGCFDSSEVKNCIIKTFAYDGVQTDCMHYNGAGNLYPVWNIVHDNILYDMNQHPTAHNDGLQSVLSDGWLIYNNIILCDSVNSPEGGGMAFILSSTDLDYNDTPPVIAFNNFLWMGGTWYPNANAGAVFRSRHDGIGYDAGAQSPNHIFNNTFVSSGPRMAVVDQEWTIRLFINNITASYVRNSSYWNSPYGWYSNVSGGSGYEARSEIDSFRTNCYWRQDSLQSPASIFAGNWMKSGSAVTIGNWANWISAGGTGLFRDPKFTTNFGYTSDHYSLRPNVSVGSPVIGAGGSIQYLYNYFKATYPTVDPSHWEAMKKDIYGTPRSLTNPSIGAYEYSASSSVDSLPDSFSFTNVTNAEPNTLYSSNNVTLTGFDSCYFRASGYEYRINGGNWVAGYTKVFPTNTVQLRRTSESGYYPANNSTPFTAGSFSGSWYITNKAEPTNNQWKKILKTKNKKIFKSKNGRPINVHH